MNQKLIELQKEIDESLVLVGNLFTHLDQVGENISKDK